MRGVFEIPLEGWAVGNLTKKRNRKEEGIQEDGFVGNSKCTKDRGTETDVSRRAWEGYSWAGVCAVLGASSWKADPVMGHQGK